MRGCAVLRGERDDGPSEHAARRSPRSLLDGGPAAGGGVRRPRAGRRAACAQRHIERGHRNRTGADEHRRRHCVAIERHVRCLDADPGHFAGPTVRPDSPVTSSRSLATAATPQASAPPDAKLVMGLAGAGLVLERAPIEALELRVAESFPPQHFVDVSSGLPNGCALLRL